MKTNTQLLAEIKAGGLIYDPYYTATILNYEAGYIVRNLFYAHTAGVTPSEQVERNGHVANAKVELADLITQARVLCAVYDWNFNELIETGEQKLAERVETYKRRGVKANENLRRNLLANLDNSSISFDPYNAPRVRRRDGD